MHLGLFPVPGLRVCTILCTLPPHKQSFPHHHTDAAPAVSASSPITLTAKALTQLRKLQSENPDGEKLLLRMGVKNGGCNGMSYVMDFEKEDNITSDGTCGGDAIEGVHVFVNVSITRSFPHVHQLIISTCPSPQHHINHVHTDNVMEVEGFRLVCCNKSLLYLFGLQLDYSDALVGGGFSFQNPNSKGECGCGKSFSV